MLEALTDGNWEQAFSYVQDNLGPAHPESKISLSHFTREDVEEILGMYEDSPEGYGSVDMMGFFKLKDGRYAIVFAWADTSGWG